MCTYLMYVYVHILPLCGVCGGDPVTTRDVTIIGLVRGDISYQAVPHADQLCSG